jgi:hypothetical protein
MIGQEKPRSQASCHARCGFAAERFITPNRSRGRVGGGTALYQSKDSQFEGKMAHAKQASVSIQYILATEIIVHSGASHISRDSMTVGLSLPPDALLSSARGTIR